MKRNNQWLALLLCLALLTGGVQKLSDAEALLQGGKADLIGVGRALLKDAAWASELFGGS